MALAVSIGLNGILNCIYDLQLRSASGQVNNKPIEKFIFTKKRKTFQTKTWEDLEVGDIIKVEKNQELPADVMILDISGNGNE
jgi:magnesium-transporting ATPase (P-type)